MSELEIVSFCPACFADERSGSWGHVVIAGHCTNCGNTSTIQTFTWAVDEIRKQASFVGKRFYPTDEDRAAQEERAALLALVDEFPGRTARECDGSPGDWWVTQVGKDGLSTQTRVTAADAKDAMRKCGLRYTPAPRQGEGL